MAEKEFLGVENDAMLTKRSKLFDNLYCESETLKTDKEVVSVNGFFKVHMKHSCNATLALHYFSVTTYITAQFNMQAERFSSYFGGLFNDIDVYEEEIYKIINDDELKDEKITIRDVVK